MTADIYERVGTLEDEVAGLDSALDARTRELWTALNSITAMVAELRDQLAHARE